MEIEERENVEVCELSEAEKEMIDEIVRELKNK